MKDVAKGDLSLAVYWVFLFFINIFFPVFLKKFMVFGKQIEWREDGA